MVHPLRALLSFLSVVALALPSAAQKDPAKGPDKEVAEKIALLKEVVADKKFARDAEGLQVIDQLLQKTQAQPGPDPKDQKDIVKALEHVLSQGKARPHDKTELYVGAAQALGYCGADGAKVLHGAYLNKNRYPEKPDWVPFREHVLKNLGRTKDETMVKFLVKEARQNPEAALQAAAGEALGNFDESKEALRKEIVGELLVRYGELDEKASQIGTNIEAQNAQDRLAALQEKWNGTLAKLTRQNHTKLREWQVWYNKNKDKAW
jgi:hypothetical protein